jgi:hypothetical protein
VSASPARQPTKAADSAAAGKVRAKPLPAPVKPELRPFVSALAELLIADLLRVATEKR